MVQMGKPLVDCSPASPVISTWFYVVFKRRTSLPLTPQLAPPPIEGSKVSVELVLADGILDVMGFER